MSVGSVSSVKACLVTALLLIALISSVSARVKRCYVCRSRSPLGDCKDPFEFNSTIGVQTGVEEQPCASGWCGKSLEGEEEGKHIEATERMCLQRPPSDNRERCAQTFYGHKKKSFFMCFCKGDLCNNALTTDLSFVLILVIIFNIFINIKFI